MQNRMYTDLDNRVKMLKSMDYLVGCFNNEDLVTPWLMGGVPDQPSEDDYVEIASDLDSLQHCCVLFSKLIGSEEPDEVFFF